MLPNLTVTVLAAAFLFSPTYSCRTTILVTGLLFSLSYKPPLLAMELVEQFHRR